MPGSQSDQCAQYQQFGRQQLLTFKYLSISTRMYESDHRIQSPPQPSSYNLLLSLKEKKRELLGCEKEIRDKVKQYYSDLTLMLQDKETAALDHFDNQLCSVFQNIDSYCAMTQTDRYQNRIQIFKILSYKLDVVDDGYLKQAIKNSVLGLGLEDCKANVTIELEDVRTSKKGQEKNHQIVKQAYLQEIAYLEEKLQKLALKQEKIKARITEMQSRQKMKKVGNNYLPYEEKITSSLLIERLESENKILINQIAESSQRILELRSENSMLHKQTQLMSTEKKKIGESMHIIEESIELSQFQERVSQLESQVEQLRTQLEHERAAAASREQEFHGINDKLIKDYQERTAQLTDYKQRLQNECDSLQSKKMELQSKLADLQTEQSQLLASLEAKAKENQSLREMNSNYGKLLQIKEQKMGDMNQCIMKLETQLKQSENKFKTVNVEHAQELQKKQSFLKAKQTETESLRSMLKKEQSQKVEMRDKITILEQHLFNNQQTIKTIENQIAKANKEKQAYCKKQVSKVKKELKKAHQDEKAALIDDFKAKYGQFMEKLQTLKKQYNQNIEKIDKKVKLSENRMDIMKERVSFQMKQVLQKLAKPGQKQKLFSIIESYIQSQATMAAKTAQIKMLKQEIATSKKQPNKKDTVKPVAQVEVVSELQQFEKKVFTEKLQLQRQIYEAQILEQSDQHSLALQEKESAIQSLNAKVQAQEKSIKELKSELSAANLATNPEISQLRKINGQFSEKEERMEGQINGLKNNLTKITNELQQVKDELKVKKELIAGLKKQLKDKDLEKIKLNETLTSVMQEAEKLKRTSKQANKKEAIFSQFKDKLINQTELSQQICQLRNSLEEKQKSYRMELNKKEQVIKQMKVNEELLNRKVKTITSLEEENYELKQKIKKLKIEVDRKDTLIEHLKQKQEKASSELMSANEKTENELRRTRKQADSEKCRADSLKSKLGKLQTNYQLLKLSLVRVYQKLYESMGTNKEYNTCTTKACGTNPRSRYEFTIEKSPQIDMSKYREALSILEISSEDLEFTKTKMASQYHSPSINKVPMNQSVNQLNQETIKLSKLLDSEDIDSKAIIEIFSYALDA